MSRRLLAAAGMLCVLMACRDSPTGVTTPVTQEVMPQVEVVAAVQLLMPVRELLDDPFVQEVVTSLSDQTVVRRFDWVRHRVIEGDQPMLHQALAEAEQEMAAASEDGDDDEILQAVLALVMEEAHVLLDSIETPETPHVERSHLIEATKHKKGF